MDRPPPDNVYYPSPLKVSGGKDSIQMFIRFRCGTSLAEYELHFPCLPTRASSGSSWLSLTGKLHAARFEEAAKRRTRPRKECASRGEPGGPLCHAVYTCSLVKWAP